MPASVQAGPKFLETPEGKVQFKQQVSLSEGGGSKSILRNGSKNLSAGSDPKRKKKKTDPGCRSSTRGACCGGRDCEFAQEKPLNEFRYVGILGIETEEDEAMRIQNKDLAKTYRIPVHLVENLRDVFKKIDTDEDGEISGKEMFDMLKTCGESLIREQYDEILDSLLGPFGGRINFEEFLQKISIRRSCEKEYRGDLESAFRMFDVDKDGLIGYDDMKRAMASTGNDLTDEQIRTIYQYLDTVKTNLIDIEEFESIFYPDNFPRFPAPFVKKPSKKRVSMKAKTESGKTSSNSKDSKEINNINAAGNPRFGYVWSKPAPSRRFFKFYNGKTSERHSVSVATNFSKKTTLKLG